MNHSLGRMEMMQLFRNRAGFAVRALSLTIGVAMLLGFAACSKKEQPAPAAQAGPQTFADLLYPTGFNFLRPFDVPASLASLFEHFEKSAARCHRVRVISYTQLAICV